MKTPAPPVGVRYLATLAQEPIIPTVTASIFMFGSGMVLPLLPLLARARGADYSGAGLLLGGYGVARLVSDLAGGYVADRFGTKAVGGVGAAVVAAATMATALASTLPATTIAWTIVGLGSGLVFVSLYAALIGGSDSGRAGQAFGLFYSGFNIGIIGGAVVGGAVAARFGLSATVLASAAAAAACACIFFSRRWLTRQTCTTAVTDVRKPRSPRVGEFTLRLRQPLLTILLLEFVGVFAVAAIFDTAIPLFARERLHFSYPWISLTYGLILAGELAVMLPAGVIVDRFPVRGVLTAGLAGIVVIGPLVSLVDDAAMFLVLATLLGFASGVIAVAPAAMLARAVDPRSVGTGSGVFLFFGDVGLILGPIAAGVTIDVGGFRTAFAALAAPFLLCLPLVLLSEGAADSRVSRTRTTS